MKSILFINDKVIQLDIIDYEIAMGKYEEAELVISLHVIDAESNLVGIIADIGDSIEPVKEDSVPSARGILINAAPNVNHMSLQDLQEKRLISKLHELQAEANIDLKYMPIEKAGIVKQSIKIRTDSMLETVPNLFDMLIENYVKQMSKQVAGGVSEFLRGYPEGSYQLVSEQYPTINVIEQQGQRYVYITGVVLICQT